MDKLNEALGILAAVVSTMDTISVTGIDNQDKFVGCAQAVKTVAHQISDYIASSKKEEETDG